MRLSRALQANSVVAQSGIVQHDGMRTPWDDDLRDVHVHTTWKEKREGLTPLAYHQFYEAAKTKQDFDAARELIRDIVSQRVYFDLFEAGEATGAQPKLIAPAAQPGNSNNALAIAHAVYLSKEFGWELEKGVFQQKVFSRDLNGAWPRIANTSQFYGEIDTSAAYVIVDDVITLGGTIADLRSFIVGKGGRVIAASALASRSGNTERIRLTDGTLERIRNLYGDDISKVDDLLGYGHDALTEAEGCFVADCPDYERLRKAVLGARNAKHVRKG